MPMNYADLPITNNSISTVDGVFIGETMLRADVNNAMRAMAAAVKTNFAASANTITAASVFTLASISSGDYIRMAPYAGQSITSFGPATDGLQKFLESTGTQILRNGASLSVQGGADLTLAAGDLVFARRDQSVWKARVFKANGSPIAVDVASVSASAVITTTLQAATISVGGSVEFPRPSFKATKSTTQGSISSAILLTFDTEAWDIGGYFASNTWTPPSGKYRVSIMVEWSAAGSSIGEALLIALYKNGVTHVRRNDYRVTGIATTVVAIDTLVDANGTDAFTVVATKLGTVGSIFGAAESTFFSGERV